MLEVNQAAGEYTFEIQAELRTLQFRTNQQQTAENWVNWVTACSNEKRYQDTLKQLLHTTEEGEEDAESISVFYPGDCLYAREQGDGADDGHGGRGIV